jgi:hypothetical protein
MKHSPWITPLDAANLEMAIRVTVLTLKLEEIKIIEIGVREGYTARGIKEVCDRLSVKLQYTGIDSEHDMPIADPFPEAKVIRKLSNEAVWDIEKAHIIIVDGCHNLKMTALDFLLYKDYVIQGGLMIFHDTGEHIKFFTDYQGEGDRSNPDNWIACRKALALLGMYYSPETRGFELIVDAADSKFHTGGYSIFRKL